MPSMPSPRVATMSQYFSFWFLFGQRNIGMMVIMERMSKDQVELLAMANTHGKKFFATGGSHVCSDDFLKHRHLLRVMRRLLRK